MKVGRPLSLSSRWRSAGRRDSSRALRIRTPPGSSQPSLLLQRPFEQPARDATAPASYTVASKTRGLPTLHGLRLRPLRWSAEVLDRPAGSSSQVILADHHEALDMTSSKVRWRGCRHRAVSADHSTLTHREIRLRVLSFWNPEVGKEEE